MGKTLYQQGWEKQSSRIQQVNYSIYIVCIYYSYINDRNIYIQLIANCVEKHSELMETVFHR